MWYRTHPTWAAATNSLSRGRHRHRSNFCEHIRLSAIAEFHALRNKLLTDGLPFYQACNTAAYTVIGRKREIARAASKERREARYGPGCDRRRDDELAAAARARGKIPKGWHGADELKRIAQWPPLRSVLPLSSRFDAFPGAIRDLKTAVV